MNGSLMLRGDESVLAPHPTPKDQVLSIRSLAKTMVQAQEVLMLGIRTAGPDDQSATITHYASGKQLAERQGDIPSHGVGRKHG